jgi:hypothetical protein
MKPISLNLTAARPSLSRSATAMRQTHIPEPVKESPQAEMLRTRSLSIGVNLVNPSNPHLLFQQDTVTERFIRRGSTPSKFQMERVSSIRLERELAKRWHPDNMKKPKKSFDTMNPNEMKISSLVVKLEENKINLQKKFSSLIRPEYKELACTLGTLRPPNKVAYAKSFQHEATKVFNRLSDLQKSTSRDMIMVTEPAKEEPPEEEKPKEKMKDSKLIPLKLSSRGEQKLLEQKEAEEKKKRDREEQIRQIARHQAMMEGNRTLMKMRMLQEYVFRDPI